MRSSKEDLLFKIVYYIGIVFIGGGVFFFLGENGPILLEDSETYLYSVEDLHRTYLLYPIFLKIVYFLVGAKTYLYCIFVVQAILAFCSSLFVAEWARRTFNLNYATAIMVFLCSILPYGYSLPECVLTHQILTEAMALPIFNVYMVSLIQYLRAREKGNAILLLFLTVILVLIRPHLLILLGVDILVIGGKLVYKTSCKLSDSSKIKFYFVLGISLVLLVFGAAMFVKQSIGKFPQLTDAVAGRVLCTIDEKDEILFQDEELEVFKAIYKWVDENSNRYIYFPRGLFVADDIMYSTGENVNGHVGVILEYYKIAKTNYSDDEMISRTFVMRDKIISKLFNEHFVDYLVMTLGLLPQSFIASIFVQPDSIRELCYLIGAILYLGAILFMVSARKRYKVEWMYLYPLVGTLSALIMNVILTNIVFYGIQRYMIYTFGWFYLSMIILLTGIIRARKLGVRHGSNV